MKCIMHGNWAQVFVFLYSSSISTVQEGELECGFSTLYFCHSLLPKVIMFITIENSTYIVKHIGLSLHRPLKPQRESIPGAIKGKFFFRFWTWTSPKCFSLILMLYSALLQLDLYNPSPAINIHLSTESWILSHCPLDLHWLLWYTDDWNQCHCCGMSPFLFVSRNSSLGLFVSVYHRNILWVFSRIGNSGLARLQCLKCSQ